MTDLNAKLKFRHTGYAYDDTNRLTTLTDEASQNFTFGYDNADKLISKTMPNNITTTYDYDGMSRLKRLKNQSATATLTDNNFTYNAANQISQIAELAQTKTFTYDNVDRLTGMTNGTANESYNFDAVGNRNSSHRSNAYGYQANNKLISTQTASYNYDANGNMLSKSDASGYWIYSWDYENRMTTARNRNKSVRYQYDALGRRVSRIGKGVGTTKYTYDGMDVVLDDGSDGVVKYQNAPGIDNKLKLTSGGISKYFLQDHLGSTVGLTDSSGAVTSTASYDSFGNSTNNLTTRYQFTGREYDSFTGLQYNRARWYDSNLGRFISQDPIGFASGDINLYGYVRNNPLSGTDSLGLTPEDDQQLWQAQQDLLEALEPVIQFGIGFGDNVLFGLSKYARPSTGVDECSAAYQAGEWTAIAIQAAEGGVGIYRAGVSIAGRFAARRAAQTFFEGAEFSPKVLRQMSNGKDLFHGFPESVDGFASRFGKLSVEIGGDGKPYQWLRMNGGIGEASGTFEFTKDSGNVIYHRFFRVH